MAATLSRIPRRESDITSKLEGLFTHTGCKGLGLKMVIAVRSLKAMLKAQLKSIFFASFYSFKVRSTVVWFDQRGSGCLCSEGFKITLPA